MASVPRTRRQAPSRRRVQTALAACPVLSLALALAAPAGALDLRVVTNHRGDDGLPSEFSDNHSDQAQPIAPGGVVLAQSTGSNYQLRASADELGNSAVDIQSFFNGYTAELVEIASVQASQVHVNPFSTPASARFSFFLPDVSVFGDAANAQFLYDIEITVDLLTVWDHQGVMEFDAAGNPDWRWAGEDIGMPAAGPLNDVSSSGFFGTAELGVFQPGQAFTLGVEKLVQVTAMQPGYIEGAFLAIGDPDDLSMSPFLGEVRFEQVPEPAVSSLLLGLLALARRCSTASRPSSRRRRPRRSSRTSESPYAPAGSDTSSDLTGPRSPIMHLDRRRKK